ncbi:MAG: methyltransferase, TIGR04325 family [Dokdonella sp.]|nr:MAG: methyltransferase, TIGR04325 family [Gammaproteobacteria bacterium]TXI71836.1 MAG: methyltransferase, TIGR04325 family [Dokdonella sp.]
MAASPTGAPRQDSATIAARPVVLPVCENCLDLSRSAFIAYRREDVGAQRKRIRRILDEICELPVISLFARPLARRRFRAHRRGNAYFGAYASFAEAKRDVPQGKPADYNTEAAADLYTHRQQCVEASDYPALFWLKHFLDKGARRIFDMGGHVGLSYYAFAHLIDYPGDLHWQVHDLPRVMEKGRQLADERGVASTLEFVDREQASGCDVFMAKGVLQYLECDLAGFLRTLAVLPRQLLINLTPMHPQQTCFTLQNIGVAVCPYRISGEPQFIADLQALGYRLVERWEHHDRAVRIPFEPQASIDRYLGYCFVLDGAQTADASTETRVNLMQSAACGANP